MAEWLDIMPTLFLASSILGLKALKGLLGGRQPPDKRLDCVGLSLVFVPFYSLAAF